MNRRVINVFGRNAVRASSAAVLFLLISPVLILAIQHSDEWVRYNSKEGRYSVLLPAQPSVDSQEATSANGEKFTQYKATLSNGNVIYMIGYFDYASGTMFTLDKARDGMVDAVKGTLLSERSISQGGAPGREVRIQAKDSGVEYLMMARFCDIDRRVYVIQLIAPKSDEAGAEEKAARYFDSFRVLRVPQ